MPAEQDPSQKPALTQAELQAEIQAVQAKLQLIQAYEKALKAALVQIAPEAPAAPTATQLGQQWKALDTVGDGSCGFNAIALGIGFHFARLRPVKPQAPDSNCQKKNPTYKQENEAFKQKIVNWLKEVKTQWGSRNNSTLPKFSKEDQEAIFNLIYHKFPGKKATDLEQYQKDMAPILRKYTAHGLHQEVDDIFAFFNNQKDVLYFPMHDKQTKVVDLKIFVVGQGLISVETETNQSLHQTANNKAGLLGALDEDFRDPNVYPTAPTLNATTTMEAAKLAHKKYIEEYKQCLKNECLTNLENAPTWLSARGMVACNNIIHTENFPFKAGPLYTIEQVQALQRYELQVVEEFPQPQNHSENVIYIKKDKTYSVISKGSIVNAVLLTGEEIGEVNAERLSSDKPFKAAVLSALNLPADYEISLISDLPAEKTVHVEQVEQQLRCLYKQDGQTIDKNITYTLKEKLTPDAKKEILKKLSLTDYGVNDAPNKSNVVYLEKTNNALRCIFKTPGKAIATGTLQIQQEVSLATLNTQRADILKQTSIFGHTISSGEENAGPFNLHIMNLEGVHWELLKEEQDCAAIQYPGGRYIPTAPSNPGSNSYNYKDIPTNDDISETQTIGFTLLAFVAIGIYLAWSPLILCLMGVIGAGLVCERKIGELYNAYCPNIMDILSNSFNYFRGNNQKADSLATAAPVVPETLENIALQSVSNNFTDQPPTAPIALLNKTAKKAV